MDEKKSRHTAKRHHAQARLAVRLHQHADDGGQLWLPNFDMNEQVKMNKHIPENLVSFKDDISKQKHWMQPVSEEECEQHAGFMAYTRLDPEVGFIRKKREVLCYYRPLHRLWSMYRQQQCQQRLIYRQARRQHS